MKEKPILTNSRPQFREIKPQINNILKSLGAPHIDSFDYMISEGLSDCVANLIPMTFKLNNDVISLKIEGCSIDKPRIPYNCVNAKDFNLYPTECRQRAGTYSGMLNVTISWSINGIKKSSVTREFGGIPIMVKSSLCHLNNLSPQELVKKREHENEFGGYFVVKGHEKLIRMLLMNRRNFPIAIKRSVWKDRGLFFTDLGILIRCVSSDQTSTNNVLHFLNNSTMKLMVSWNKVMSYLPILLVLKALVNVTDEYIYKELLKGFEEDHYFTYCIKSMLRALHEEGIHTHADCVQYIGQVFANRINLIENTPFDEVCAHLLKHSVLIHLNNNMDKFNSLVFMIQKLFQVVQDKHKLEGSDGVMMQEVLLGGYLYQQVLKTRLDSALYYLKKLIIKTCENERNVFDDSEITNMVKKMPNISVTMDTFLATGNITASKNLGLMQTSGLVIQAENINRMRYMSHFRAVHRGSFFVTMRTTEARQLLPDAWGFICPVHTPDGTPCGLLNHLTVDCIISTVPKKEQVKNIPLLFSKFGMLDLNTRQIQNYKDYFVVQLEGAIIGYLKTDIAVQVIDQLRLIKIQGIDIPATLEIVHIPKKEGGAFPGIYCFVGPARMMRPVMNLAAKNIEYIGTFEQVFLDICITKEESYAGITTHMELSKTSFMSNLANLIPMPDCNQSPRNMYQCQMGKQSMGTPCHNWQLQGQTKHYRLQTPDTPLFRPVHYDNIELDDFPMGINAVVAVISYTGYDMEDAMIINKSAYERGFAHGSIYHSEFVELEKEGDYFGRDQTKSELNIFLDTDGLPQPGIKMEAGNPLYCYYDTNLTKYIVRTYKSKEMAVIDNVRMCGGYSEKQLKKVCITYRIPRNPNVGDKFASRAGQKGICSQKWPAEDLPFTESGLIPDIIFNPHGFPSRMTIAMMIEVMAGKTGSLHGLVHDATPFKFTEKDTAIDYFGKLLEAGGYNYYGTEKMYSGVDGRELQAEIFFGVVHYQRLRHMVSDKWQVRSTGPVDLITHQPNKGRKRGGGVRFGEMERDALISHGASFLLQDRLFHCSDKIQAPVCRSCGTLLGPVDAMEKRTALNRVGSTAATCRLCGDKSDIGTIEIPYIFKFLVSQLSSCNINVKMNFKKV